MECKFLVEREGEVSVVGRKQVAGIAGPLVAGVGFILPMMEMVVVIGCVAPMVVIFVGCGPGRYYQQGSNRTAINLSPHFIHLFYEQKAQHCTNFGIFTFHQWWRKY